MEENASRDNTSRAQHFQKKIKTDAAPVVGGNEIYSQPTDISALLPDLSKLNFARIAPAPGKRGYCC